MKTAIKSIIGSSQKFIWRVMDTGSIKVNTDEGSFQQIRLLGNAIKCNCSNNLRGVKNQYSI